MININSQEKELTGGWFNISIFAVDEVLYCPAILTNANASKILFKPPTNDIDILPVGENITITATPQKTKSGTLYNITGALEIPMQSESVDTYFNSFIHKQVFFIGIKHSGQQKIFGSKTFPLSFSYQLIDGKKLEDGAKIKIKVFGKIPQKPVFIND